MMKYKNMETCPKCSGCGKLYLGYDYNDDGISVTANEIKCDECNGYGFILTVYELPDDFIVKHEVFNGIKEAE